MLIPSFHPGFRNNHSQASCESLESIYLHPWMLLGRGALIQLKFLPERLEKPQNFYLHGFLKVWNVRCPEILGMWPPQQPRSGMGTEKLERNIPSWKRTGCGPREILECWWEWERWERGDCSSHLQENRHRPTVRETTAKYYDDISVLQSACVKLRTTVDNVLQKGHLFIP